MMNLANAFAIHASGSSLVRRVALPFVICAGLLACYPAKAEDQFVEAQTNSALDVFFKVCVTDRYRAQLMFELAEKELWPRLPSKLVESRRMPDLERFEGWIGYLPALSPSRFFVYAGDASDIFDGKPVQVETCAMFFGSVLAAEFIAAVRDEMGSRILEEVVESGRSRIVFQAPDNDNLIITLVEDENTVEGRGIFAATVLIHGDG